MKCSPLAISLAVVTTMVLATARLWLKRLVLFQASAGPLTATS